jgi:hypothetical protein
MKPVASAFYDGIRAIDSTFSLAASNLVGIGWLFGGFANAGLQRAGDIASLK